METSQWNLKTKFNLDFNQEYLFSNIDSSARFVRHQSNQRVLRIGEYERIMVNKIPELYFTSTIVILLIFGVAFELY